MSVAQRLYEGIDLGGDTVGLITYMRTDGVAIAPEAIAAARQLIGHDFGARYLPEQPRVYKSPAKNAQEAHEAIRPTDMARKPEEAARHLDNDQRRLYELIWKRTVASQMASALLDQVSVDIADPTGRIRLHATGSVILFDGFLRLYQEDRDDRSEAMRRRTRTTRRPPPAEHAREGEADARRRRRRTSISPSRRRATPRRASSRSSKNSASAGPRPTPRSCRCPGPRLRPARKAPLPAGGPRPARHRVPDQLFERYVEYNFTADLENQLDEVSGGRTDWKELLRRFWQDFWPRSPARRI